MGVDSKELVLLRCLQCGRLTNTYKEVPSSGKLSAIISGYRQGFIQIGL